jgi:hypothetical protein
VPTPVKEWPNAAVQTMLMGWMAPAPTGVAMRHTAVVYISN